MTGHDDILVNMLHEHGVILLMSRDGKMEACPQARLVKTQCGAGLGTYFTAR